MIETPRGALLYDIESKGAQAYLALAREVLAVDRCYLLAAQRGRPAAGGIDVGGGHPAG